MQRVVFEMGYLSLPHYLGKVEVLSLPILKQEMPEVEAKPLRRTNENVKQRKILQKCCLFAL